MGEMETTNSVDNKVENNNLSLEEQQQLDAVIAQDPDTRNTMVSENSSLNKAKQLISQEVIPGRDNAVA